VKPFKSPGRQAYKIRLALGKRDRVCGTDTYSLPTAKAMAAWAISLRRGQERRMDVYEAIIDGRVALSAAYDRRRDLDGLIASLSDVDIEPRIAEWKAWKSRAKKGSGSADKYETQVRTLIPAGIPFLRSQLTTKAVRKHLAGLDCDDATRNRYKAAFSSFARYLVDHDVIERNVVRDIPGWPAGESRETWYEMDDAKRVIAALPQPNAAMEALMCGACLEWQAIARLTRADVDRKAGTVYARGTKKAWRTRTCKVLEIFDWCWPYIEPALVGKLPSALVFPDASERSALAVHHAVVATLKLPHSRLHDWRHTHLVLGLKHGYPPLPLSRQAGHKDANLLWTVYGKHVPRLSELVPQMTPEAKNDGKKGRKAHG
jgi:integrase